MGSAEKGVQPLAVPMVSLVIAETLSGTGRFATRFARIDSRESFAIETPILTALQADSHESRH